MNSRDQKNTVPSWLASFDQLRSAIKQYQLDRSLSMLSPDIKIIAIGDKIEYTIKEHNEQI